LPDVYNLPNSVGSDKCPQPSGSSRPP
jgi:hypothetical protein